MSTSERRTSPTGYPIEFFGDSGSVVSVLEGSHEIRKPGVLLKIVIRACIAMEYPPRKFHPLRKKPQSTTENAVDYIEAKLNKMIRDCKALGIRLLHPGERQRLEEEERRRQAQYEQLEGDLIEDLPARPGGPKQWKLERRQNMIHRDFDPTNSLSIRRTINEIG